MNAVAWNMLHYSNHLLLDIYPLSKEGYRSQSVRRRASYDYLNQIVEEPYKAVEFIINILRLETTGSSYKQTLRRAKDSGILPADIVNSLMHFRDLRNKVIHENPKVNESLLLYPELFELIVLGFAMYEVFSAYAACGIESFKRVVNMAERTVEVDKAYLLKWLNTDIDRGWSDGFYDGYDVSKNNAHSMLRSENNLTRYVVDVGAINKRCA